MLALVLTLAAAPDAGMGAPSAREMAQLYFLAGDLRRAVDVGRRCLKAEGKKCDAFYRALVEYEALIARNDKLTEAEARAYLEWDRLVSPKARGKLTEPVWHHWVVSPLEGAGRARSAGDLKAAGELVDAVLRVDPKNPDAKALKAELSRR